MHFWYSYLSVSSRRCWAVFFFLVLCHELGTKFFIFSCEFSDFIEICFTYHTVHPLKGKIQWFLIYLQLFTQHSCDLRGISQRKEGQKRNSFSIYVQIHIVIILPDIPKACSFGVAKSSTLHRNGRKWEGKESKVIYLW